MIEVFYNKNIHLITLTSMIFEQAFFYEQSFDEVNWNTFVGYGARFMMYSYQFGLEVLL